MFVLDTDHISLLEHRRSAETQRLQARLDALAPEEPVVTIISFEEQMRGWLAYMARAKTLAQQIEAYGRLKRHLDNYRRPTVLEFDDLAAVEFQSSESCASASARST